MAIKANKAKIITTILTSREIVAICKVKSQTKGLLNVATLGAMHGISGATVRRIWARNKELCK